jgi:hypothetical protein
MFTSTIQTPFVLKTWELYAILLQLVRLQRKTNQLRSERFQ